MRIGKASIGFIGLWALSSVSHAQMYQFANSVVEIRVDGQHDSFWTMTSRATHLSYKFTPPSFQIDGKQYSADLNQMRQLSQPVVLPNGVTEYTFEGAFNRDPSLSLRLTFQLAPDSPVLRFHYVLQCSSQRTLTRNSSGDALHYFGTSFASLPAVTEVRLSDFNDLAHSYTASERVISRASLADDLRLAGPILVGEDAQHNSLLIAFEHGATVPDTFLNIIKARMERSRSTR
jgi:alpha-galactosidase